MLVVTGPEQGIGFSDYSFKVFEQLRSYTKGLFAVAGSTDRDRKRAIVESERAKVRPSKQR